MVNVEFAAVNCHKDGSIATKGEKEAQVYAKKHKVGIWDLANEKMPLRSEVYQEAS